MLDLGLVLTHACNLACTYCYTGEKKRVRMTREMGMRAIDIAFDSGGGQRDEVQITFFGGEPLLEADLLVDLATYARARAAGSLDRLRPTKLLMQTTTNGTLLDRDLLQTLTQLRVHLALSIDGTRAAHDAGRPLAGGGASFDQVERALRLLLARANTANADNAPFDVICVVDPCNVHSLAESVEWLANEGVDSITLNMNWGGDWTPELLAVFDQELEKASAIFIAWLRRGRYIRIQPLEGVIQTKSARSHCEAGIERFAIAPSGRVYNCPRSVGEDTGDRAIGHLDQHWSPGITSNALNTEENRSGQCACAVAEEARAPITLRRSKLASPRRGNEPASPVLLHHNHVMEDLGRRIGALLSAEYTHVHVTENRREER